MANFEELQQQIALLEHENHQLRSELSRRSSGVAFFTPSGEHTTRVPEAFKELFDHAEATVHEYFRDASADPSKGVIEIGDQRYVLVRASALSIDFLSTIQQLYADRGTDEAHAIGSSFLFDIAHTIGINDARDFHRRMNVTDPIAKLSAGPVHFAYSGWALVDIKPESTPSPDEDYLLIYSHPYSFEADSWLRSERRSTRASCIMNAGYSSGWCEESFGIELTAVEVSCRAKGDESCTFVMAPPHRIAERIREYIGSDHPEAAESPGLDIPTYFERKKAEEKVRYRLEFERLIAAISARFINLDSARIDEEIIDALRRVGRFAAVDRVFVSLHDLSNPRGTISHQWTAEDLPLGGTEPEVGRFSFILDTLRRDGEAIFSIADLPPMAEKERQWAEVQGIEALVALPIVIRSKLAGTVSFISLTNREWDSTLVTLLRFLSGVLSHALERKQTEKELRESEARFRTLVEHAPEAIVVFDVARNLFVEANDNAIRFFGHPRDVLLRLGPTSVSAPGAAGPAGPDFTTKLREAREGDTPVFEWIFRSADGVDHHCEVRLVRLPSGDGQQVRGSITDITDRKEAEREKAELEDQLRHAQRMESIGRLAGGVAHDFNNMLTLILANCDLLLDELASSDPRLEGVKEIKTAGQRAAELTSQLLAFSRKQVLAPRVIDLNTSVANMERMLRRILGEDIELSVRLAKNLDHVRADTAQIEQIVLNLAVNGRDAMPEGGTLEISTGNVTLDEHFVASRPEARVGPHVLLAISDTGVGMTKEVLSHVFEPFFTTKGIGKGTGLGLSMVYGIVRQSDGFIEAKSSPGQGTTFRIFFPSVDAPLDEKWPPTPAAERSYGLPKTLLLVEDDEPVRSTTVRLLRRAGFVVLSASCGADAIKIAESLDGPIDLLLTDVVMPTMEGPELAKRLSEHRPSLKVLYMSGYSDDALGHRGVLDPGIELLEKPFDQRTLLQKIDELLR